jgi:hypothetical protein
MFKKIRGSYAVACGVAALALVTLASGVTYAATRAPVTTITACVHHSGGGLYKAAKCATGDSSLTWDIKGAKGATGAKGTPGLSLFVRADETAKVYQHSAGVTVTNPLTGVYTVRFPQNISKCAAVVSQGETSNNGFTPGVLYMAVVQSDTFNTGNVHEVNVYPSTVTGTAEEAGFDLVLAC